MSSRDSFAMPLSPPPPSDIGTYSRSMLQHTKRQMEAVNGSNSSLRSQASGGGQNGGATSTMPNGVGGRIRNPSDYGYQT